MSDAAADRERDLISQDRLVIGQLHEAELLRHRKLRLQGLGGNSYAHRRKFMSPLRDRVPDQDVAIQPVRVFARLLAGVGDPVVVIGGALAIMMLTRILQPVLIYLCHRRLRLDDQNRSRLTQPVPVDLPD